MMRRLPGVISCVLACALASVVMYSAAEHPSWAYGYSGPPTGADGPSERQMRPSFPRPPVDAVFTLPGSDKKLTRAQVHSANNSADWYPADHAAMPDIVQKGRMDAGITACALCHLPNGKSFPDIAPLAGLSEEYFIQTMNDFKNDVRKSADPRKTETNRMITFAKRMTDEEIRAAARYYAAIPRAWSVRVIESRTAPKTVFMREMFVPVEGSETEPLGQRIVEMPENAQRADLLDPRLEFVAYAPVGSIKKGETLVRTGGNGRTVACGVCHGADLEGMGPVPGIAGRYASYLVRQMYDMQVGARKGVWSELMTPVVEKLTAEDFIAIGAYLASRPAAPAPRQTAAQ